MLSAIESRPLTAAVVIAFAAGLPHVLLEERASVSLTAVTLAIISGIYVGLAAKDTGGQALPVEAAVALSFGLAAVIGLSGYPWVLPGALALHGIWDLVHHMNDPRLADAPRGYPTLCCAVDLLLAVILVVSWAIQNGG